MESQLRLTVVLGFGILYILYQKSLCLFLVCPSPTLSGMSTLSQQVDLNSLADSQLCLTMEVCFDTPYILYQKLLCLLLEGTSPAFSVISNLSQEIVKTLWGISSD